MAQVEPAGANLPAQPIGATDLLAISVYGAPELTRTVRVSDEGVIRLPMLRERIDARGMMPAALETRIAAALAKEEILVDPAVTVTIAEYHSRPISVAGAVRGPLTFQALGRTTLLEALTRAQGFSEDAGAEILVSRPAKAGQPPLTERIPRMKVTDAADPLWNVILEGGEEIRVPQVGRVFVIGNVKKPGAFRVEDGGQTTLLKALAMAEGLAPYAGKFAYVYRPVDGARTELVVALGKIMDRKAEDVNLTPNDILYIPDNRARRLTTTAIEKAIAFAAGTASGALILGVNR
jgi:polysaccharide export outer membrane protein